MMRRVPAGFVVTELAKCSCQSRRAMLALSSWRVAIGLLGARLPFALIVGYSLHGLWDLLHEFQAHGAYSAFEPGQLTAIQLAYGVCCAAIDLCLAAYFCGRHSESIAAWRRFHSEDGYLIGSR